MIPIFLEHRELLQILKLCPVCSKVYRAGTKCPPCGDARRARECQRNAEECTSGDQS